MKKGMRVKFWIYDWVEEEPSLGDLLGMNEECDDCSYNPFEGLVEQKTLKEGIVLGWGEYENVLIACDNTEYNINIDDIIEEVL